MRELVEVLAVALHEEHRHSPGVPLNPKRCVRCRVTGKRLVERVLAHLRAVAADEGVQEDAAEELRNVGHHPPNRYAEIGLMDVRHAVLPVLDVFLGALEGHSEATDAPQSPEQPQGGVTGPSEDQESL